MAQKNVATIQTTQTRIRVDIKIEMNESEVRKAIAEYINNRPHWVNNQHVYDNDVKIEVGREYHDRQPGDPGTEVFKKAVITVKPKPTGGTKVTND